MPERLEWAGFKPLQPDRIHIYCPRCGRRRSNAPRAEYDPPTATLAHIACPECSAGDKDGSVTYLDDNGNEVDWEDAPMAAEAPGPNERSTP